MNYQEMMAKGFEGEPYSMFFHVWPWIGLGAAVVLILLIFCTDFLCSDKTKSRFFDPVSLAWMGAVIYLLHNVEEYGIDIYGNQQAFTTLMYQLMGFRISEAAYLCTNLCLVWCAGPLAAIMVQKGKVGMASVMAVFEIINGLSHIGQAINLGTYNAGLINSLVLCLPLGIWTVYQCYWRLKMPKINLLWLFLAAVLYHVILFAGIFLAKNEILGTFGQGFLMALDAVIVFCLWYWIAKAQEKKQAKA